jgi:3-hydroxyacyl-CoA dehydrogenase/3a,7a,12a-trihydroxy-5b-cholest-24-enoyl-CoA hydratase
LNFSTTNTIKFLYENHPEFCVFPTFGVIPAQLNLFDSIRNLELPKGVNLDLARLLHGEQYLELYKPLASSDDLTAKIELVDVLDKGSGASLVLNGILLDKWFNF